MNQSHTWTHHFDGWLEEWLGKTHRAQCLPLVVNTGNIVHGEGDSFDVRWHLAITQAASGNTRKWTYNIVCDLCVLAETSLVKQEISLYPDYISNINISPYCGNLSYLWEICSFSSPSLIRLAYMPRNCDHIRKVAFGRGRDKCIHGSSVKITWPQERGWPLLRVAAKRGTVKWHLPPIPLTIYASICWAHNHPSSSQYNLQVIPGVPYICIL